MSLSPTRVYMRKIIDGAVLVLRLSFDQLFVCADLFSPMAWPLHSTGPGTAHVYQAPGQTVHQQKLGSKPFVQKSQAEIFYAGMMVQETLQLQVIMTTIAVKSRPITHSCACCRASCTISTWTRLHHSC